MEKMSIRTFYIQHTLLESWQRYCSERSPRRTLGLNHYSLWLFEPIGIGNLDAIQARLSFL